MCTAVSPFSRRAHTYDAESQIQQWAAERLAAQLPSTLQGRIVELGCGTGLWTAQLHNRYPENPISSTDSAPEMVTQAQKKALPNVTWAVGQAQAVTFPADTGLVTANACLHWLPSPARSLTALLDRIPLHSAIALSLFGPGTFSELSAVLSACRKKTVRLPAQSFLDAESLATLCSPYRLVLTRWECKRRFPSVHSLLRSIHRTGTYEGGFSLLQGPRQLQQMEAFWHQNWGGIWCSYEVFLLCKNP
ncbi:MAG: methyltransferase domain-containing protein [Candidatus Margulisiibacteriota bacterium]